MTDLTNQEQDPSPLANPHDADASGSSPGLSRPETWKIVLMALIVAGGVVARLALLVKEPVSTGDVTRHLLYGAGFWEFGPSFAGEPLNVFPGLEWVTWSSLPYNYPPVALLFFAFVSALHASVFGAKLALTLIEGINAWLVWRITRDRWCAVIVWCAPISLWWVTREAQFEGLQSLFLLAAIYTVHRRPRLAWALFAIAIQTKLTAVFLLPFMIHNLYTRSPSERNAILSRSAQGFALGCLLTAAALCFYPVVSQVAFNSTPLRMNPFHWNVFDIQMTGNWFAMKLWDQTASWALLLITATALVRTKHVGRILPALIFIIVLKSWSQVHFWYWIALMPMLTIIPHKHVRRALFVIWAFSEFSSTVQLVQGPMGFTMPPSYYESGLYMPVTGLLDLQVLRW